MVESWVVTTCYLTDKEGSYVQLVFHLAVLA